jgi:hypothetical protein
VSAPLNDALSDVAGTERTAEVAEFTPFWDLEGFDLVRSHPAHDTAAICDVWCMVCKIMKLKSHVFAHYDCCSLYLWLIIWCFRLASYMCPSSFDSTAVDLTVDHLVMLQATIHEPQSSLPDASTGQGHLEDLSRPDTSCPPALQPLHQHAAWQNLGQSASAASELADQPMPSHPAPVPGLSPPKASPGQSTRQRSPTAELTTQPSSLKRMATLNARPEWSPSQEQPPPSSSHEVGSQAGLDEPALLSRHLPLPEQGAIPDAAQHGTGRISQEQAKPLPSIHVVQQVRPSGVQPQLPGQSLPVSQQPFSALRASGVLSDEQPDDALMDTLLSVCCLSAVAVAAEFYFFRLEVQSWAA